MVFSSIPPYLDPPNWQQHPNQQLQNPLINNQQQQQHDHNQHQLIIPVPNQIPQPQPQPQPQQLVGPGQQQIRPMSMAEQARQLKIPPPAPLKCPRCDSSNTKFCYFNNYSLLQPRHFCKTCRRYWTHNGALRNVPVGGGCRRNKRGSSSSSSKSSPSSSKPSLMTSAPSTMVRLTDHLRAQARGGGIDINSLINTNTNPNININNNNNNMSFLTSLQNNMGLAFDGGPMYNNNTNNPAEIGGLGSSSSTGGGVQFPNFLEGFEIPGSSASAGGLYSSSFQQQVHQLHNNSVTNEDDRQDHHHLQHHRHQRQQQQQHGNANVINTNDGMSKGLSTRLMTPLANKMEGNNNGQQRLNSLANQMMIIGRDNRDVINGNNNSNNSSNNQFNWGVNDMENVVDHVSNNNNNNNNNNTSMWTDMSTGLNPSSTSHLL